MSADAVLLVVVGVLAGFALGHVHAWRFGRKLERHGVRLAAWDQPFDPHAPVAPATVTAAPSAKPGRLQAAGGNW